MSALSRVKFIGGRHWAQTSTCTLPQPMHSPAACKQWCTMHAHAHTHMHYAAWLRPLLYSPYQLW